MLCPGPFEIHANELADMAAREGTIVEQEEVSHHYDSAKVAIQRTTMEPPVTHECRHHIYGEEDKK